MRGTRWLLLVAIIAILGGVGAVYRFQKRHVSDNAPIRPASLDPSLSGQAEDYLWVQTQGDKTKIELRAKNVKQVRAGNVTQLEGIKLKIIHKDGVDYDLVTSAHAEFTEAERRLFSDGEVEIILGLPVQGEPKKPPITIKTSGVTFDSTTGRAITDRLATFVFASGSGKAVGGNYDPATRELHMQSQVELFYKRPDGAAKEIHVEAGELTYKEASAMVVLTKGAKVTRDRTVLEAAQAVIRLDQDSDANVIRNVEAEKANGSQDYPTRKLRYAAEALFIDLSADQVVEKIRAQGSARLVSTSETAESTLTAPVVDMHFANEEGESVLRKMLSGGGSVMESKPLPVKGKLLPETRILRSQVIEVNMRPGGEEIDSVVTPSQGNLEFLPNRPVQHRRTLTGDSLFIKYGARNQLESFTTVNAVTQTDPLPEEKKKNAVASHTRSKNLKALFDEKTGQMSRLEQWDDFAYDEGDRRATAARAIMEGAGEKKLINLETAARVWDATGSTYGDRIRLDQATGNFTATGHVNSTRLPDKKPADPKKKKDDSGMLAGDEPMHALAEAMTSANRNRQVHYEGNVVLWQSADRITAHKVDIDREKRTLIADGSVITQFREASDEGDTPTAAKKPDSAVRFTVVKANHLVYTETERLAHYTGNVFLTRTGLQVKAGRLKAFLAEKGADDRIEKAYADDAVNIVQFAKAGRTLTGTSEHSEYYTEDAKIILNGGAPQMLDSEKGYTRGRQLTYFMDEDRMLVEGAIEKPATTRIRKKK